MRETERIADQLQRAFSGPAWHGPSLSELLANVTAEQAACKPNAAIHSIWTLVLHVSAWQDAVRRRLAGEIIDQLPPEQDFRTVKDASPADWERAKAQLEQTFRALHEAILALPDSKLYAPVPGKNHDAYFLLHGVVQHNLYHAGQIAVLKKLP